VPKTYKGESRVSLTTTNSAEKTVYLHGEE
jgi:hypothetical protein